MSDDSIYLVVGIRSNFSWTLTSAMAAGRRYGYTPWILDVGASVSGWRGYPNDWNKLDLADWVIKLSSRGEILKFIRKKMDESSIVLFLYLPDDHIRYIWFAMKKQGAAVGAIVAGPVPTQSSRCGKPSSIKDHIVDAGVFVKRQFKPIPDFWITSGPVCKGLYHNYFRRLKDVPEIKAHSVDYEKYRLSKDNKGMSNMPTDYALLLDQGWFTKPRPDFLDARQYPPARISSYAVKMRRFLSRIETMAGAKVIVACHPKADYSATRELYSGFEVSAEDTVGLVSGARLVIANSTTAIQYAVLERKPIVLFTSNELDGSIVRPLMEGYRRALRVPVVNIDHDSISKDTLEGLSVQGESYREFEYAYIRHADSPAQPLWDTVFDGISRLHGTSRTGGRQYLAG